MMYKTHIAIAKGTATSIIIYGMLTRHIPSNIIMHPTQIPEMIITSAIIYVFTCWGSQYPDMDLPNSKASHANIINMLIAKILATQHLHHRSILTHSVDLSTKRCILLYIILLMLVKYFEFAYLGNMLMLNTLLILDRGLFLIVASVWLGNVCHIFADYFTQEGAYLLSFLPKVKLVPADFGWGDWKPLKKFYSTGDNSPWELGVRRFSEVYFSITLVILPILAFLPVTKLLDII